MFSIQKRTVKKGFILMYTLLLGSLCILLVMCLFTLKVTAQKYGENRNQYVLRQDIENQYKAVLLTQLQEYLKSHEGEIQTLGIIPYLTQLPSKVLVTYGTGKVEFQVATHTLAISFPYEVHSTRIDLYEVTEQEGKTQLQYKNTIYK